MDGTDDDADASAPPEPHGPSLDGRLLRSVANDDGGEVDGETVFEFSQDGDLVHAEYAGGRVRLGFLVGTVDGERLEFRYAQLLTSGETQTGRSVDEIEVLEDGRVRLHERWSWDSADGEGTSVLEEVAGDERPRH